MNLESILTLLLVGLAAGWLSGLLTKRKGFGFAGNLVVGVLGALLGGALFRVLGFATVNLLGQLVAALVGSLVLLFLLRFVKR